MLLNEQTPPTEFGDKISEIYTNYLNPDREPVMKEAHHRLVPITDIHLEATGGPSYLYIFGAIAALLLLIAIISFVNLMTAQASKRAMEIGVRKVMGSSRKQLLTQFLSESVVFSLLATGVAILLVFFTIPILNGWLDLQLDRSQIFQPAILLSVIVIWLLAGILGGSYPAFFLSAFQPIQVLKGQLVKSSPVRRALVGVQFAVVLFVLICTGMINEQLQFMRQKDLGFNKEQVVHLELSAEGALEKVPVLKTSLEQSPLITSVGTSSFLPGLGFGRRPISADNGTSKEPQFVAFCFIDYDYLKTLDIEVVAGRNFSTDHPLDAEESVLVNEQFARTYGLDNLVGERIRMGDSGNPNFETIVGVVKDFHAESLHEPIGPQLFFLRPASFHLAVKIQDDFQEGIALSLIHI